MPDERCVLVGSGVSEGAGSKENVRNGEDDGKSEDGRETHGDGAGLVGWMVG